MRFMSWIVGLGVVALAVVSWLVPMRRKSAWEKAADWTKGTVTPLSRSVMRSSRKMIRGMVK